MRIDGPGQYVTEGYFKAIVKHSNRFYSIGEIGGIPKCWENLTGEILDSIKDKPFNIVGRWDEPDIPLDFHWDLPVWSTGFVKYMSDYDKWFYSVGQTDWVRIPLSIYWPKSPYPKGWQQGRVFERPSESKTPKPWVNCPVCETLVCHHCAKGVYSDYHNEKCKGAE